jgi:hypothetical protein
VWIDRGEGWLCVVNIVVASSIFKKGNEDLTSLLHTEKANLSVEH